MSRETFGAAIPLPRPLVPAGMDPFMVEIAEGMAERVGAVEVFSQDATVDWFEVTEANQLALGMQVQEPLEVGSYVAKVLLPCRREEEPA